MSIVVNSLVVEVLAWMLVISLIFPKSQAFFGKGFSMVFEVIKKSLELLVKILSEVLKLISHLLQEILNLLSALFKRR